MSDERVEQLEAEIIALKTSLIAVIRLLGPDFRRRFSDVATGSIVGHVAVSNLSMTEHFESVILEIEDGVSEH